MHTLRLSLVGTVILMLLGGLGGLAVAQTAEDADPDAADSVMTPELVTGTERCVSSNYTWRREGDAEREYLTFECTNEASDPRVSGPAHGDFNTACYQPGCVFWGDYEIDGTDGTWSGTWRGTDDALLDLWSFMVALDGTGAYEGWSFLAHWQDGGTGMAEFSGMIYPGPLPPFSESAD